MLDLKSIAQDYKNTNRAKDNCVRAGVNTIRKINGM